MKTTELLEGLGATDRARASKEPPKPSPKPAETGGGSTGTPKENPTPEADGVPRNPRT